MAKAGGNMTKPDSDDVRILIKALEEAVGLMEDAEISSAIKGSTYIKVGLSVCARLRREGRV